MSKKPTPADQATAKALEDAICSTAIVSRKWPIDRSGDGDAWTLRVEPKGHLGYAISLGLSRHTKATVTVYARHGEGADDAERLAGRLQAAVDRQLSRLLAYQVKRRDDFNTRIASIENEQRILS